MTNVAVPPALSATLVMLADAMAAARHCWWAIGGAAVTLHGVTGLAPADVDVVLHVDDARDILPRLGLPLRPGAPHADFRSALFGIWRGPPLPVEFMAGFEHRVGSAWHAVSLQSTVTVPVETTSIPIPGRAELRSLLLAFGRPKDVARAAALAAQDATDHPAPSRFSSARFRSGP